MKTAAAAALVIFRQKPSKLLRNILKSILTFIHVMSIMLRNSSQQPDLWHYNDIKCAGYRWM
jgi:hypothetical protein